MDIQLKRGLLDVCVLAAIKQEDSYGYKIIKDMKPYVELSESTLYPILRRLEAAQLLSVHSAEHNGRLRKYYHITEQGQKRLEDFKAEYADRTEGDAPKVLILMGLPGSYVVATESSYVGSLVKLDGGINVYGDGDGQDFLNVNTEDMVEKEPDIILRTSHAMPEQVKIMFAEEFETNDIWKHFSAVQNGKVYDLDNEKFGMSATFRYQEALEELQPILYES